MKNALVNGRNPLRTLNIAEAAALILAIIAAIIFNEVRNEKREHNIKSSPQVTTPFLTSHFKKNLPHSAKAVRDFPCTVSINRRISQIDPKQRAPTVSQRPFIFRKRDSEENYSFSASLVR